MEPAGSVSSVSSNAGSQPPSEPASGASTPVKGAAQKELPVTVGKRPVKHKSGRGKGARELGNRRDYRNQQVGGSINETRARAEGAIIAARELRDQVRDELAVMQQQMRTNGIKSSNKEPVAPPESIVDVVAEVKESIRSFDFYVPDRSINYSALAGALAGSATAGGVLISSQVDGTSKLLGIAASVAVGAGLAYYFGRRGGFRIRYAGDYHHVHGDRRPDSASLLDLKHANAHYGMVELTDERSLVFKTNRTLYVSFEICAQLMTAANMRCGGDRAVAWERIQEKASSLQTVNYDRYLALQGINVVQDSAYLVYAMYLRLQSEVVHPRTLPFPSLQL